MQQDKNKPALTMSSNNSKIGDVGQDSLRLPNVYRRQSASLEQSTSVDPWPVVVTKCLANAWRYILWTRHLWCQTGAHQISLLLSLSSLLLLSASLYFSKRGAYWNRLCRDVVGWLSRRCLTGAAPRYLTELAVPVASTARRRLRSVSSADLVVPSTRRSTIGDRAFAVAGPRAWNSLPSDIRTSAPSFDTFKKHLKSYLFNCLFPACRACDYVYIDYVRRSRSSSCRLLRPINCQTYITLHKVLSLTYKVLTTAQPSYLHNLISLQPPRSTLSSSWISKFTLNLTTVSLS